MELVQHLVAGVENVAPQVAELPLRSLGDANEVVNEHLHLVEPLLEGTVGCA